MLKKSLIGAALLTVLAAPSFAGDIAEGEKAFKGCRACHAIIAPDGEVIYKGGKTGPNLYGVIGRTAGTLEGFKYGKDHIAAGEAGLVFDEATLIAFTADPKGYLSEVLGTKARSKMSYKLRKGGEDIAAYLAQFQ